MMWGRAIGAAVALGAVAALGMACVAALCQESVAPEQIRAGAEIFERNCAPCHGPQMRDPESAFDLRKFPHNQHDRFVNSVTRGKNQMPPWGDMLKSDEIEALWAYVTLGER